LGQSENVLLIKPFLAHLTDAEIHQVMTSGFSTISGSVLYGYLAMGKSE
jgi:CNT family concentrative nucleoside transporter